MRWKPCLRLIPGSVRGRGGGGDGTAARLAAYLTPADAVAGIPGPGPIAGLPATRLPAFMIPASFTELAALPLTPGGKIDRTALPEPGAGRRDWSGQYVAPRTKVERDLARIWADVLNVDRVGVEDNFFELGGHSLLVTQIVAQIRASGYDTSVGDLFDHPTVVGVAALIEAHAVEARLRSVVRIRRGSVHPALYVVHTITGEVAAYAELGNHLGEDQQLIGLQQRGLTGDDRPQTSVRRMAETYLREVYRLQPDGPYLFAAQSGGCYIAFEMARQATAVGKQVGGIFLMGPPTYPRRRNRSQKPSVGDDRALLRRLDDAIQAPPGTRLSPADEDQLLRLREPDDEIALAVRAGDKHGMRIMRAVTINGLAYPAYGQAMRRHPPYDGRVVLFMPREDPDLMRQVELEQWLPVLAQKPEIVDIPGDHSTVLYGDGVRAIGKWLSSDIARWTR